jgi:hypothetical protein
MATPRVLPADIILSGRYVDPDASLRLSLSIPG